MNEPCYLRISREGRLKIQAFNLSVFDVLLLFNSTDVITIHNFYGVDNYGTKEEKHLTEKDIIEIQTIGGLYSFFDKRGGYGEHFTLNILEIEIRNLIINVEDDYNISIHFPDENTGQLNEIFRKILRLLKFVDIESPIHILNENIEKFVVFDEESNIEIFDTYTQLSESKIFR